jgi:hypothetical protein
MRNSLFPRHFRTPSNIAKYDGKTNPSVWLEDYCLGCRARGPNDDLFIIQFLPIYLAKSARAWLDHLPRNAINHWDDLWKSLPAATSRAPKCAPVTISQETP